jgi:hypothetical protein
MSRRLPAALMVCVLGLVALTAVRASGAPGGSGCHPSWPVVAHDRTGRVLPKQHHAPVACGVQTGYATSESTIAVTGSGALVYSPANTENDVAVSNDQGASWHLSAPQEMQYTALWNTTDPYVTVDRRTGRLFWVHATGPTRTTPAVVSDPVLPGVAGRGLGTAIAGAYGFQVYSSGDDGRTWRTADYSTAPMTDWEKVFVGPAPAGAAKPVGYPDVVYVCANSPWEVVGPGRLCYKSLDGGATFTPAGYVFPSAGMPDACLAVSANNAVVGRDGTIYHPVTCLNGAYVVVSHDEGLTYAWSKVPGVSGSGTSVASSATMQIAIDDADNVYALSTNGDHLEVRISRDHAKTWGAPLRVSPPGMHSVALATLAAGGRGQVGVGYYASPGSGTKLNAYVTQTWNALAAKPVLFTGVLNDPKTPIFVNGGLTGPTPRADYVGVAFDRRGTLWAGMVAQLGLNADGTQRTVGYVGHLARS